MMKLLDDIEENYDKTLQKQTSSQELKLLRKLVGTVKQHLEEASRTDGLWFNYLHYIQIIKNSYGFVKEIQQFILNLLSQQTFFGLEDILKTSSRHVLKTFSTRLQGNNSSSSKTSSRRLQDISCKTS